MFGDSLFLNHDVWWAAGLVVAGLWMSLAPLWIRRLESERGSSLWTEWLSRMDPPASLKVSTLVLGALWLVQSFWLAQG